jgi:hypothetical protein
MKPAPDTETVEPAGAEVGERTIFGCTMKLTVGALSPRVPVTLTGYTPDVLSDQNDPGPTLKLPDNTPLEFTLHVGEAITNPEGAVMKHP